MKIGDLRRKAVVFVLMALLAGTTQGCFFPLLVGAGAGVGGYAWYKGYLKTYYNAPVETVARSSERTLDTLGFQIGEARYDKFGGKISGRRQATDSPFVIVMQRAGPSKTLVKIRVGVPGDRVLAEELDREIKSRL